jgi:hypothetical protein
VRANDKKKRQQGRDRWWRKWGANRNVWNNGIHDSEARIRKHIERRDQVEKLLRARDQQLHKKRERESAKRAYPDAAIRKARLDRHGENLLDLDGNAAFTQVAHQLVSIPPACRGSARALVMSIKPITKLAR